MPMKLRRQIYFKDFSGGNSKGGKNTHDLGWVTTKYKTVSTYKVARTSMTVRLTWTTMSRYSSVKRFTIWLKKISIAVGRFT